MALVSVESERYLVRQERIVPETDEQGVVTWIREFRIKTTTITTHKGDKAQVEKQLDLKRDDSRTMRKIEGPWWEATVATVTETPWAEVK